MSYGLVGAVREKKIKLRVGAIGRVVGNDCRGPFTAVLRQERQQLAQQAEGLVLVVGDHVGDAALAGVDVRASELVGRDLLARDLLHDLGPGEEHVRGVADHHHKIGDRG